MKTLERFDRRHAIAAARRLYDGNTLTDSEIERLLNHLLPALPAAPRNVWDFVARAMAVNDMRYYLNAVHVIDGIAYATDGHRMHYAHVTDIENGVYGKDKKLISDPAMLKSVGFFERVMPKCRGWKPVAYSVELVGDKNIQRVARMDGLAEDQGINLAYLLDAVAGDKTAAYSVGRDDGDHQISVRNKFGRAVVMGMRL